MGDELSLVHHSLDLAPLDTPSARFIALGSRRAITLDPAYMTFKAHQVRNSHWDNPVHSLFDGRVSPVRNILMRNDIRVHECFMAFAVTSIF